MRWRTAVVAALVLGAATGCSSSLGPSVRTNSSGPPFTITGRAVLTGPMIQTRSGAGSACVTKANTPTYDVVEARAHVVVVNELGRPIGTGHLGRGTALNGDSCAYPFTVSVPSGPRFYGIKVAKLPDKQYTAAQAAAPITVQLN